MTPEFSICIPTYNRADILDFCLERLQPVEKLGIPFEIVVSDNASTDHTADVVMARQKSMPYIRFCRQKTNVGMWSNYMNALWNGSSGIVVYVADDDWIIPENLAEHLQRFKREPELVGMYTDSIAWDDERQVELHRYYPISQRAIFEPNDPLALVNFIFQNTIYPEIGIYRREQYMRAGTIFKHGLPPFHLWMYRMSRQGRISFEVLPFYRENRVLIPRLKRGHWGNMDLSLAYIDDRLRITLESFLLVAMQDAGMPKVPDEQGFPVRKMIERFLHNRTVLEIQRAINARNWLLAMELRRRLVLWYGPGAQADEQRDAQQISVPAVMQAIQEMYEGLEGTTGVEFRGFQTDQILQIFRSQYPTTPATMGTAGLPSSQRPLVIYREQPSTPHPPLENGVPTYVEYLDQLLSNYRVNAARFNILTL